MEFLVNKFKTVYIPDQHISIDEELLLWKGNLSFKQYIPTKRAPFGIKMFSLCENSGYLWNSFVYMGKEPGRNNDNPQLVQRLGKSVCRVHRHSSRYTSMGANKSNLIHIKTTQKLTIHFRSSLLLCYPT